MDFTRSYNLNSAPVVGSGPQQNSPDTVGGTYAAASEGVLDIPSGSVTGAAFSVPFGSVGGAKAVFVKNSGPSGTIKVAMQGSTGAFFELAPGGAVDVVAGAVGPAVAQPVSSVGVYVGAVQPGLGQVRFIILGE